MSEYDALVLGAGPAGLGAGLALARAGARVLMVDGAQEPGGLCVTRRREGFAYDLGGHIPFVRDAARERWLRGLLGDDLVRVDRPVACVRDGAIAPGRYLDQRPPSPGDERPGRDGSAAGELGARFGAAFVDAVMRPYLEKIDGVALERIPAERALRLLEGQAAPDGFFFPARGIGQLMDAMADAARQAGAEVRMGTRVRALRLGGGRMTGAALEGAGGDEEVRAGQVVVAMAAGAAARLADPAPPAGVLAPVRMRAVCLVYLAVPQRRLTPEPWVQVDDPRVPFARAFEPVNWSGALVPGPEGVIGLECYCRAAGDDPVWGLDDPALAAACARALADPLGWLDDPARARAVEVIRLPAAYPEADLGQVPAVRGPGIWLDGIAGLHLAQGSAVIEAIEAGERAAAAVLAGEAGPHPDPEGVPPIS